MEIKNYIKAIIDYGTNFSNSNIVKSQVQKANFFYFAYSLFLLFTIIHNALNNEISLVIIELRDFIILLCNHLLFRIFKKPKLYLNTLASIFAFMLCESLIFGGYYGAGLIGVGILIITVMNISGIHYGSFLSFIVLLIDIFVCLFNNKIDWVYQYPESFSLLYHRFLAAHVGIFVFTYIIIKKQNELLIQVNKDKEQRKELFLNIVHDLKTPLTIINNKIDKIIDDNTDTKSKKTLKSSVLKMEKNILNILNHNSLEKGQYIKGNSIINISELTNELCLMHKDFAETRDIIFETDIEKNIHVKIDEYSYTEILGNLIDNAIKYTNSGGEVSVFLKSNINEVSLIIQDTGIGIDKAEKERIFEAYYQVNKGNNSSYGSGIGLSIVQKLCELFCVNLEVESYEKLGTKFLVTFKKENYDLAVPNKYKTKYKYFSYPSVKNSLRNFDKSRTLLIVEDNLEIREILIDSFSNEYNILPAVNGREALNWYNKNYNIDLIITDIMMPVMDGIDFVKQLRKNQTELVTPIIILTAKSGHKNANELLKLGAIDYIRKPFSINELKLKVDSIVKLKENKKNTVIRSIVDNLNSIIDVPENSIGNRISNSKLRELSITKKEEAIIQDLAKGYTHKEIASNHEISLNTVRTHVQRIYKKCEVNNSVNLIKIFYS